MCKNGTSAHLTCLISYHGRGILFAVPSAEHFKTTRTYILAFPFIDLSGDFKNKARTLVLA